MIDCLVGELNEFLRFFAIVVSCQHCPVHFATAHKTMQGALNRVCSYKVNYPNNWAVISWTLDKSIDAFIFNMIGPVIQTYY